MKMAGEPCGVSTKKSIAPVIIPIKDFSTEAAKEFTESIALIFLDGDHAYNAVKADFESWMPRLSVGGIIALHDTLAYEGVRKFVGEVMFKSNNLRIIGFIDSIIFAEKIEKNSIGIALNNGFLSFWHRTRCFCYHALRNMHLLTFTKRLLSAYNRESIKRP